ncbi:hypothetical protein KAFR_0K00650 [Kazachstania africana CBS 2517]|uniref:Dolichyl-phosphate-mannose--protein mannosyltransferase n=1 Tax=Kazachstania africana (strain ATCC 22294 / BCRC 22015 / CBS 2517 / CECT 1963 / NBRC 1671 / NRRL Y-8276) TaxID=1071382 RepID=H2B1C0_KAZAF|nr:hypothetical protein KAFR_0K00650 [Kazachstania africana CBS 2517]CCF60420.1 hypothetical protein KAFR_0K00650 [Kazachstania africana CBS 2517]
MMSSTTGYGSHEKSPESQLRHRDINAKSELIQEKVNEREDLSKTGKVNPLLRLEAFVMPIVFTLLALFTRMYRINANSHVVWDEAHFGSFGSYYLKHEFYHDVHPPLGKMLVGFSGYLAGYNGSFDFASGAEYPDYVDFVKMRIFNASFSAMCVPLAYFTAKAIGFSLPGVWFFTVLVLFENTYCTLGRFILLDSMLLCFTVASFFCFVKFHNERKKPFGRKWWKWMCLTGISLGCTISVKMVGLFVISLVGIYTIVDLWNFLGEKSMPWKTYINHWLARILGLIILPLAVFMWSFYMHFTLLTNSGSGDAVMSSLYQATLIGSEVGAGPRDVAIGSSIITIKNQKLGGALLHSHYQLYPTGSQQQQITAYGFKDNNNEWFFDRARGLVNWNETETDDEFVKNGNSYRLVHRGTGRNLHTHPVLAAMTKSEWEVAGYGDHEIGDLKDNWVIEVIEQKNDEDPDKIHPLTTLFRIRSDVMDCHLAQTDKSLPEWGFRQGEIVCLRNAHKNDKRTWWNIETHENERLPEAPEDFKFPKPGFLESFIHLNRAMMASNNALVTADDKYDPLASSAWEWPTLHTGLRLNHWGDENVKYYLLGTPVSTWGSSIAVLGFMIYVAILILRWQRQYSDLTDSTDLNLFLIGGFYPLLGWGLHFMPFVIMSRVTYVHHYLPALYFALIIFTYVLEACTKRLLKTKFGRVSRLMIFTTLTLSVTACFAYFAPISFGMDGPKEQYAYLGWFSNWIIGHDLQL